MAKYPIALKSEAVLTVVHGSVTSVERPEGAAVVYWIGSVEPANATATDLWIDTSASGVSSNRPDRRSVPDGARTITACIDTHDHGCVGHWTRLVANGCDERRARRLRHPGDSGALDHV
jgi:hypothetical protein